MCVQCTLQCETVIFVCTKHMAELDNYLFVYTAQCSLKLLLMCVLCTVDSDNFIGVCTLHSAE